MRPTVHDIARAAGVSLATVDRVLNARPGVRGATIVRVNAAVDALGYVRDAAAANLARSRRFRLAFVLPRVDTAFHAALRAEVAALRPHAAMDRALIELAEVPAESPAALAATLDRLAAEGIDGVAVMAAETPQTRDALRRLRTAGVRVVTLVADLAQSDRDHFVGINNVAAGRTAGVLMGRFLGRDPGRILVLAAAMSARDQAERRLGFDRVMQADFPQHAVLPTAEAHDDPDLAARRVAQALATHGPLQGIYCIGSGKRGLARALAEAGLARRTTVIVHELSPQTRLALEDGTFDVAITVDVGHMVRSAVRVLRALAGGGTIIPAQERIRLDVVLRENLP